MSFGANGHALRLGSELGVLSFGAGMLIGLRVTLSMLLGSILAWVIAPGPLVAHGWAKAMTFAEVLKWVMWPATGLMVAGGITALVLNWKVIARTFKGLSAKDAEGTEFPMRWTIAGAVVSSIALAVVQKVSLDFPIWLSVVSLAPLLPARCWWASGCSARPTGLPSARSPTSCRRSSRRSRRATCR